MVIKNTERATVYSSQYLGYDYPGWPAKLKSVFSRSALTFTRASLAGLTREEGTDWHYWCANSTTDETCDLGMIETSTFKITADSRCVNNVMVTDQVVFTNTSGSTKTLVSNADTQVLKLGKKNVSNAVGAWRNFYARVEVPSVTSVTTVEGETSVGASFAICLNEDLVDGGDELSLVGYWNDGDTTLGAEDYEVNPYGDSTYTVPEDNPYDQMIYIEVVPDVTVPGVHTAVADVVKDGTSVTEDCPNQNAAPAWPSIRTIDGPTMAPQATTNSRTMPTWTDQANTNWDRYGVFADGLGGAFHYGVSNDEGAGAVQLVNFDPISAQNGYHGNGLRSFDSDSNGYFNLGRYGAGGVNQFTLIPRSRGNWEYTTATMASGGVQTTTFTKKNLAKLCEKGYTFTALWPISAPTLYPTAILLCSGGNSYRQAVVSIAYNTPVVQVRLGSPSKSKPCVSVSYGVDSSATASEVAVVAYTATMSRDADRQCTGVEASVSARSIVLLNAQSESTTTTVGSSPWPGGGEPSSLRIAPGASSGEWIGISINEDNWQQLPGNHFSISTAANPSISVRRDIELDDSTSFGDYPQFDIVKDVGDGHWLMSVTGSMWIDGEYVVRASVASIDYETGGTTNGDVVELSGFGTPSARTASLFSGSGPAGTTFFEMTGLTSYSSTTWSLPLE